MGSNKQERTSVQLIQGSKMSKYKLEVVSRKPSILVEYAKTLLKLVKEEDKRSVREVINRMQSQYHIDHYFISEKAKNIGVVKISQGSFFALGLDEVVNKDDYKEILNLVESYVGGWRVNQIEATLNHKYVEIAESIGYKREYSRLKMRLDLHSAKNKSAHNDLNLRTYRRGDFTVVVDMFVDAFKDTIDEQIGYLSGGTASSVISSAIRNGYGEFRPDMTPILTDPKDDDYILGASLTTIFEGCPFVVLIGVRTNQQASGIGRQLLSWVIDKSIDEGYDEIKLWVTVENSNALALYESLGFEEITRTHTMYRKF